MKLVGRDLSSPAPAEKSVAPSGRAFVREGARESSLAVAELAPDAQPHRLGKAIKHVSVTPLDVGPLEVAPPPTSAHQ